MMRDYSTISPRSRHKQAGDLAAYVLSSGHWSDQAAAMHAEVAYDLTKAGFEVEFEAKAYPGRIDLLCRYGIGFVAIELDARRPRKRSVEKLRRFDAYRIIGLRGVEYPHPIRGIDEFVCLRVSAPTFAEARNKRSVNRFRVVG